MILTLSYCLFPDRLPDCRHQVPGQAIRAFPGLVGQLSAPSFRSGPRLSSSWSRAQAQTRGRPDVSGVREAPRRDHFRREEAAASLQV